MPYIDIEKVLELDYQLRSQSKSGFMPEKLSRNELFKEKAGSRSPSVNSSHSLGMGSMYELSRSQEGQDVERGQIESASGFSRGRSLDTGSPKVRYSVVTSSSTPKYMGSFKKPVEASPNTRNGVTEKPSLVKWRPVKSQDTFHDGSKKSRVSSTSSRQKRRRLVKGSQVQDISMSLDPALYGSDEN